MKRFLIYSLLVLFSLSFSQAFSGEDPPGKVQIVFDLQSLSFDGDQSASLKLDSDLASDLDLDLEAPFMAIRSNYASSSSATFDKPLHLQSTYQRPLLEVDRYGGRNLHARAESQLLFPSTRSHFLSKSYRHFLTGLPSIQFKIRPIIYRSIKYRPVDSKKTFTAFLS